MTAMKRPHQLAVWIIFLALLLPQARADETSREGDWIVSHRATKLVQTLEMTLWPRGEPKPALKHRLLADPFTLREGNAALFYLKAMGFFEQDPARERLGEFRRLAQQAAVQPDGSRQTPAPYSWLDLPLAKLPLDEAKDYLKLLSFQEFFMAEAAQRKSFTLDRDIRRVDSPISYLLPEIQAMRELARNQSLRLRVAIREGRIDDAIRLAGEQLTMAHHLGQDEFLISNLVGTAITSIAWHDLLYISGHPEAPNLYWALAALPEPLAFSGEAWSIEQHMLFLEIKPMTLVDEHPKSSGYWDQLANEILDQLSVLDDVGPQVPDDQPLQQASRTATLAAAYPAAKRFLIEQVGMNGDHVTSLDEVQTVLLASRRHYEIASDDLFRWAQLPLWQLLDNQAYQQSDEQLRTAQQRDGLITLPANLFLPAFQAARHSIARADAGIALVRSVEAIRDHAAHDGALPVKLEEMRLPAPIDPFTGKPLPYEYHGDHAVLSLATSHIQYRLVLRLADAPND